MTEFKPCEGATSDHAWRSISVEFVNSKKPSHAIQGATWNMQMWCTSKEDAGNQMQKKNLDPQLAHANNPLDISESRKEYFKRKKYQLLELEQLIKNKQDFIFLQEPDWVKQPTLLSKYKDMLKKNGWDMIVTPADKHHQSLVTLYNTHRLTPDPKHAPQGCFKNSKTGRYRGYQANFIDTLSNKPIALVNLHLEFDKDYRDEMLTLQQTMVSNDLPCIMGGDTNNVQNMKLSTMIGDWHAATNVSGYNNPDDSIGLTTQHQPSQHPGGKPIEKTYDGFFVNPGLHSYARITETGGMRFNDLGNGVVEYKPYIPKAAHAVHITLTGEPWQPLIGLNTRLQKEYVTASDQQKQVIDRKINMMRQILPYLDPNPNQPKNPVQPYYQYANTNRYHLFCADYNGKKGDSAKGTILETLLTKINACQDIQSLMQLEITFLQSPEYSILSTGQGLATKIFGLKTSSVKAMEQMFDDAKFVLRNTQNGPGV